MPKLIFLLLPLIKLTTQKHCYASNCLICSSKNSYRCTWCMFGYYQSWGSCDPCSEGCSSCFSLSQCTQCKEGYYLDDDYCTPSVEIPHCAVIENNERCSLCEGGYFLQDKAKCLACQNGCENCTAPSNCSGCYSGKCTKCKEEYYLTEDKQYCNSCPSDCLECTNSTICNKCKIGYYYDSDDQYCRVSKATFAKKVIIVVCVTAFSIALTIGLAFLYHSKYGRVLKVFAEILE